MKFSGSRNMVGSGNRFKSCLSLVAVLVSNLLAIPVALMSGLTIQELIWLYWCESLVLGVFQALRIFTVEYTSINFIKQSGQYYKRLKEANEVNTWDPFNESQQVTELPTAFPFLVMYVFIHAGFAGLVFFTSRDFRYTHALLVIGGIFCAQKVFSSICFGKPWERKEGQVELTKLICLPFARFIPLLGIFLLVIKTGSIMRNAVAITVIFILCKTLADGIIHVCGKEYVE